MTTRPACRRIAGGAALASLACLCACASEPKPAPLAPAAAPPPAPLVTMAPIANPEAAQPVRREPAPARRGEGVGAHHATTARPTPAPTAPATAPRVDAAAAARLRARGLEELNRGAVAKAVALLSQASRLDPGNAVIRRDLERAERINRAVQGPH